MTSAWSDFVATPVGETVVRLGGLVLGTILAVLVLEWLHRRVFRRLAQRTSSLTDDRLFDAFHRAIRATVILAAVILGFRMMEAPPEAVRIVSRVGRSLMLVVWTAALVHSLSDLLRDIGRSGRFAFLQPRTVPLFDTIQKVVLFGASVYLFFLLWRIDVTAWAASAGILGIAVGFAAKDTLANLFSGVFILVDAPYRIGDTVLLDTGERGRVTEVGIRSTRILTRDDVEIIIPNSQIGTAKITNESGGPHRKRRVDVAVGVSYSSDVDLVRRVLMEVADGLEEACRDPEPRVRFRRMADSALEFSLLFWIEDPEERGRAIDVANSRILARFRNEGIEIPFPQRVIHLPGAPSSGLTR